MTIPELITRLDETAPERLQYFDLNGELSTETKKHLANILRLWPEIGRHLLACNDCEICKSKN